MLKTIHKLFKDKYFKKKIKTKNIFACFCQIENYFREQLGKINLELCIGL